MDLVVAEIWPALLLAGGAGLMFTWLGGPGRVTPGALPSVRLGAATLLGTGVVLVALGAVPGRTGLWLDIAVLLGAAYAAGAVLGAALGRIRVRSRLAQPRSGESGSPS